MVVSLDVAQAEVEKWLDYKKVSQGKRDKQKAQIEVLVDAVCDGTLVLKEDLTWVHNLKFPVTLADKEELKTLSYKPRISQGEAHMHLQRFKADDVDGRVLAYVLALTKTPQDFIKRLDTEDSSIAQGIAIFFI